MAHLKINKNIFFDQALSSKRAAIPFLILFSFTRWIVNTKNGFHNNNNNNKKGFSINFKAIQMVSNKLHF